ncbi:MAG: GNAT family N-acetyltransferase, partial [Candidatus Krumholzibacteriia bacterium]
MSYAHAQYAHSLADFGSPRHLPRCGGWVLERAIPGAGGLRDAAGCYPLFRCADWAGLPADLAELRRDGLVSLVLVADPLSAPPIDRLGDCWSGRLSPYKRHHLVDLSRPFAATASAHHRRDARRCTRLVDIEPCRAPLDHLADWCRLYDELADRHAMSGPARFSREAFGLQLGLPGVRLLRAVAPDGAVVGMQLWFVDGVHAWYHLAAHGAAGYAAGVSYGLVAAALELLRREGVRTVDLGGGAGL